MSILVYVESHAGQAAASSLGVLGHARELASAAGTKLAAVVAGEGAGDVASGLDADVVYVVEGDRFANATAAPLTDALVAAIEAADARILLAGASVLGADVVGGVVARTSTGVNTDGTGIEFRDGEFVMHRPSLDDSVVVHCGWTKDDGFVGAALFRAGSFAVPEGGSAGSVEQLEVADSGRRSQTFKGLEQADTGGVDITEADILVGAGRGLGGPENFTMVESLAKMLGGEVATTRAVVDAGWYDYATQVGQTGKTVTPKLYIAVGISGAIQHKVGMSASGTIVAINKDGNAPIFDFADFGVVGDLFDIVPKLEAMLAERKG